MKKTLILLFLFLAISVRAEINPLFDIPQWVIRTKPKSISMEDAAFLFKNPTEQLTVTFVERQREYAKVFGCPIFPKKVWDIRYEASYRFDRGWNTVYSQEVSRELAKGQYNIWIMLAVWSFLVIFFSDRLSNNGLFSKKDRRAYFKVGLHGMMTTFLVLMIFLRILVEVGVQSFVNLDFILLAFLWSAIIIKIIHSRYKIPDEEKQENQSRRSISV